jgi:PmbA protein
VSEELSKVLESLKSKVDSAALLAVRTEEVIVKFVESSVAAIQRNSSSRYRVLLKKGKKYAVGESGSLDLQEMLGELELLPESKLHPVISGNSGDYSSERMDGETLRIMEDVSPLVSAVQGQYPLYGTVTLSKVERSLVTSLGFRGVERRTWVQGYLRAKNGDYTGQWAFASTSFSPLQIKEAVSRAEEYASLTGRVRIDDGKYDVVISPLVAANLMQSLGYMASGFAVLTGNSFLSRVKPGEKVANETFTLTDSPRGEVLNSWDFDDEAMFTSNNRILDRGVFSTPLLNNEVAEVLGMRSTGNAGWIYPRPWNLEVEGGEVKEEDLTSGNVILVNNCWYTRFQNRAEGQFSTVTRDATVIYRNGSPAGVVGRTRIADTLVNLIRNMESLSKQRYAVAWWDAPLPGVYPFMLIRGLRITRP